MDNIAENTPYSNAEPFLASALQPFSKNDLSDVSDAITAVLRAAGFKHDHTRTILAALAEADGRSTEFAAYFASLGARMKNRLDPFVEGEELEKQSKSNSQRWRRALVALEAEQEKTGFCFVTCKRGGSDRKGHNYKSKMTVDVETFVQTVSQARHRDDFQTKRRYAFEQAAIAVLGSKAKRTIKRLPPQVLSDAEKLERLEKTLVNSTRRFAQQAIKSGFDSESLADLESLIIEKVRFNFYQIAEGFQSDTPSGAARPDTILVEEVSDLDGETVAPPVFLESEGDTGGGVVDSLATVSAFESVGADSFTVTMRDEESGKGEAQEMAGAELRAWLPALLERNETREESLIIRPRSASVVQVDDLDRAGVERLKPFSFLTIETSPGNYQAWLAIAGADSVSGVRSRLLEKVGADVGANGATRLPGSLNRKPKHRRADGSYPRVRVVSVAPSFLVTVEELEGAELLVSPAAAPPVWTEHRGLRVNSRAARAFPSYEKCLADKGGNRSKADASFLKICELRGFTMGEAIEELKRVAGRDKLKRDDYIKRTANFVLAH
jgi:hypothetical protein